MQPAVLWKDEKLFMVQATHSHQYNRIYAVIKEDIPLNVRIDYERQRSASVMVWAGLTVTGENALLIVIQKRVKIEQHVYMNMLKE